VKFQITKMKVLAFILVALIALTQCDEQNPVENIGLMKIGSYSELKIQKFSRTKMSLQLITAWNSFHLSRLMNWIIFYKFVNKIEILLAIIFMLVA
jgi:hypothetical protein